ncbi:MAG: hypothetical protein M1817_005231 [Caeruleum heppii]|nr:MAG: hypothetical protein M1817_005231 [Caeruleum heppii]
MSAVEKRIRSLGWSTDPVRARKLSASSASGKSSSKDASRSKKVPSSDSPATSPTSTRPHPSAVSSSSSSRTSPISAHSRHAPGLASLTGSVLSEPRPGSVPGGFRTNIFRSDKEKTTPSREDRDDRKRHSGGGGHSPRDATFALGWGKARDHPRSPEVDRSGHTTRTDKTMPSPSIDTTSGDGSGDENGEDGERRSSVIGKVAHRAKMVLPLKRTRELGKSESSRSLAGKSTTTSSSSLQSSPRTDVRRRGERSSEDGDGNGLERDDDTPAASSTVDVTEKEASVASSRERAGLFPSTTRGVSSIVEHPSDGDETSPTAIVRPKTVPPRIASSEAIHQSRGLTVARPSSMKKINPPPESPAESKLPELGKGSNSKNIPLRSPRSINNLSAARHKKPSMNSIREDAQSGATDNDASQEPSSAKTSTQQPHLPSRPSALRSTSAILLSSNPTPSPFKAGSTVSTTKPSRRAQSNPPTLEPVLPSAEDSPQVDLTPSTGMYWSRAPCFGYEHSALRAHTTTLIGSNIYVFGGCDSKTCFNDLFVFDADCMYWSIPKCSGDIPTPLRAMTATAVGKKIVIFGGGDGPTYCNDVYILDTVSFRYTKPVIEGVTPCKRRAHTACLHRNGIYVFGGGDGERALNDVWRLDVSDLTKLSWKMISAPSKAAGTTRPTARGYHTANMVGSKLIIFGGSDGVECFRDVWVYDVETLVWKAVEIKTSHPRLSHTATVVGSYLFVVGGHDGVEYSSDVLLLNLVTMQWDRRKTFGEPPSGRGYHGAVLFDSRLFVIGGFDGHTVFDDTYILELAVNAYYSQISHFTIDV